MKTTASKMEYTQGKKLMENSTKPKYKKKKCERKRK